MNSSNISHPDPFYTPVQPLLVLPLALVIFVTMAGNLLVILAVMRTPQLQNPTSVFIMSLACADLIVGCVVQPLSSTMLLTGNWPLGLWACDLWTSVDVLCVTASTQTLCIIAVDRYVAVTRPLRYTALLDKCRARLTVCTVWTISALVSFIPIMGGYSQDHHQCAENPRCCDFNPNKPYAVISSIISFYIPLLVMLFTYRQVFVIATQQVEMILKDREHFRISEDQQLEAELGRNQTRRSTRHIVHQHKALKTLGLIMGVFTVCWLPFFVANIVVAFTETRRITLKENDGNLQRNLMILLNWLGYINSGLNPIIYCHSSDYRTAFHGLLHLLKPRRPSLCCPCLSSLHPETDSSPDQRDTAGNSAQHPTDTMAIRTGRT